jgi:WD40 repeat protein
VLANVSLFIFTLFACFPAIGYAVSEVSVKNNTEENIFVQWVSSRKKWEKPIVKDTEKLSPGDERKYTFTEGTNTEETNKYIYVLNEKKQRIASRSIGFNEGFFTVDGIGNKKKIHCDDLQKHLVQLGNTPEEIQCQILEPLLLPVKEQIRNFILKQNKQCKTLTGHGNWVKSVTFSPDGSKLVSVSDNGTIQIWDAQSGKVLQTLRGHGDWVLSVTFSPDGTKLASGSADKTIKIWDIKTAKALQTLRGHRNSLESVTFSPDGTKLASGSLDRTIKIWDLYKEQDQKALDILQNPNKLDPGQKMLLYVLQNHLAKNIDLGQINQELQKQYGPNLPLLLDLKQSYERLPLELKQVVKKCFNIKERFFSKLSKRGK